MIDITKLKPGDIIWDIEYGVRELRVIKTYYPDDDPMEPMIVLVEDDIYEPWTFQATSQREKEVFYSEKEAEDHFAVKDILE